MKQPIIRTYGGKQYNIFLAETEFGVYPLILSVPKYRNNDTLAVQAYAVNNLQEFDPDDVELYCDLTVNLNDWEQNRPGCAFVDVNNSPWAAKFLKAYGLAKPVDDGYCSQSGFVSYPLWKWNLKRISND